MSADTRTRRTRLRPVHDRAHRRELRSIDLAVRLSPQGVGGVLDRSVAILRSDLGLLFGVGLAIWLPLRIVLIYQLRPRLPADTLGMVELSSLVLGTVLLAAFAARVVAARLARGSVEPGRVLALGPFEVLGLLVLAAVTSAAAGIGILMLLVGALVATWLLALAPVVYVLELEHGPVKRIGYALKRSVTLVAGSFWRWLAIFTVVKLLDLVLTLPMGFLDDPAQRLALAADWGLDASLLEAAACFLGAVFLALSAALSGAVFAGFYFDQRARLEGVDLYLNLGWLEEGAPR